MQQESLLDNLPCALHSNRPDHPRVKVASGRPAQESVLVTNKKALSPLFAAVTVTHLQANIASLFINALLSYLYT